MTGAYAFTDYRSQGQTVPYVIVDIGPPPTNTISPFGAYVALSRSHGSQNIRLLRPFNKSLFQTHPSQELREAEAKLMELAKETKDIWDAKLQSLRS
ncbi:hypothetical protein SCHPADRAFT_835367 [Schizopora paradoxa]|uniref:Uncharacterized protein n=1 Tax=Schizopora paradoxa TaxID=27342 RepID=A0A0H2RFX3_9AGAM|nr:hypothetical protein SCHPADRAFT_835367 [Schizopora paradoxa]